MFQPGREKTQRRILVVSNVRKIHCDYLTLVTVRLAVVLALAALEARVILGSNAYHVALLHVLDLLADADSDTDDFVADNLRVVDGSPCKSTLQLKVWIARRAVAALFALSMSRYSETYSHWTWCGDPRRKYLVEHEAISDSLNPTAWPGYSPQ